MNERISPGHLGAPPGGAARPFTPRALAAAIAALALVGAMVQTGDAFGQTVAPQPAEPAASTAGPSSAAAIRSTSAHLSADDAEGLPRLNELAAVLQVSPVLNVDGSAAPAPQADVLTLQRVVDMSLPGNLDVRAAGYHAESFAQTRNAALGALLPHVNLYYDNGKGRLESADPYNRLQRKDGSIVASQPLFDEVARREWQRQGVLAASSKIQFDGTRSSAGLEIAGAYLQVLQTRVTIELSQEYEALLGELLRVVTERANGGGASGADRERVRGRVANARSAIADARAGLQVAKRNLERLMGGAPLASVSTLLPPGLIVPGGLAGAKALALAQNPDLVAARAEVEASDYERLGYASRFTPRISVELTHSRNVNAAGTESYYRETKAMVVVTLPLVNGGTDYAQTRAAVARREEQRARAENVERKLVQELDAAYVNLDAVHDRYASMLQEIASNRSVVAAFKDQLTASNRSLLDVLDAYQRFYQSRLDVTQLLVGETQNRLKIAHLTGTLLSAVGAGPTTLPH